GRRLHTISKRDWSSDVCSSDLRGDPTTNMRIIIKYRYVFLFNSAFHQTNKFVLFRIGGSTLFKLSDFFIAYASFIHDEHELTPLLKSSICLKILMFPDYSIYD